MDDQSAAIRKAMMLDAEWQHADAKFFAACEDYSSVPKLPRQNRATRRKELDAQPERQKQRNARRRALRAAARMST